MAVAVGRMAPYPGGSTVTVEDQIRRYHPPSGWASRSNAAASAGRRSPGDVQCGDDLRRGDAHDELARHRVALPELGRAVLAHVAGAELRGGARSSSGSEDRSRCPGPGRTRTGAPRGRRTAPPARRGPAPVPWPSRRPVLNTSVCPRSPSSRNQIGATRGRPSRAVQPSLPVRVPWERNARTSGSERLAMIGKGRGGGAAVRTSGRARTRAGPSRRARWSAPRCSCSRPAAPSARCPGSRGRRSRRARPRRRRPRP